MLDARLNLAFSLYPACPLAADIGTDHAHLPIALLRAGRCSHMILTDISSGALANARGEILKAHLMEKTQLRLGDGLLPLQEACSVISILGMGGKTIHQILQSGADRLHGAQLILSAHTDLPLVRQTLSDLDYTIDAEEPVMDNHRFYLVFRAHPGVCRLSALQLRTGSPCLFASASPWLKPYLERREEILAEKKRGLLSASVANSGLLSEVSADLEVYSAFLRT